MIRDFLYRSYLGEGEKIKFIIHRHLFMQMKDFSYIFVFGISIPLFIWWLFPGLILFTAIWFAIGMARFIYEFFDWYYDVWLVTNVSVVEIMWQGFFKKSSTRIEYHTIQGIGYEINGLMRTIFNYGTVSLDKFAGVASTFNGAVNPKKKSEMLTEAQEMFVRNKNFRDHQALQGILADLVQRHVVDNGIEVEEESAM